MANYTLDFTNATLPGKNSIVLVEKTINDTSTSLTLFGKGRANYGEGQQGNFLKMLENFADITAPSNPTIGQLWWKVFPSGDTRRPILMVCDSVSPDSWVPVGDPQIKVAYNYEYNRMVELYQKIVGANTVGTNCSTTWGWGQTALSASVSKLFLPTNPVNNANWVFLLNKWKQIAPIVGIDASLFESDGFIIDDHFHIEEGLPFGIAGEAKGIATIIFEYEKASVGAQEVYANRFNFANQFLTLPGVVHTPVQTNNDPWIDETYLLATLSWADAAAMNLFFSTGGYIKISPSLINPIFDNQTTADPTEMWVRMFNALGGGIIIKACSTVDGADHDFFSTKTSVFELSKTTTAWPANAAHGSIGKVLYKANEQEISSAISGFGLGLVSGGQVTYDQFGIEYNENGFVYNQVSPLTGGQSAQFGNDSDLGWADITVEARITGTSNNKLEIHITFDNETSSQVKGNISTVVTSVKSGTSWNGITPAPNSSHPTLDDQHYEYTP